jgi:AcrR family transcriptional regulator
MMVGMPARRDAASAADTRQRILDAVLEVIGEHGIAGLTNRRLARQAGVSLGSITYHFASQQEALREALETFVDREIDRIAAFATELGPVSLADAADAAERALEAMSLDPGSTGVLELYLHAGRDPSIREAARRCWAAYDRVARGILGSVGATDPAALAPQVVSLLAGTQLRWLATGTRTPGVLADGLAALLDGPSGVRRPAVRHPARA